MAQVIDLDRDVLMQRLREAREYLGLSQEYVAQETKIPRPAISEIEAGRRRVESIELKRLAALYGRPLDYFLAGGTADQRSDPIELKLRNLTKNLPDEDRQEILRFAEYLHHKQASLQSRKGKKP